MDNKLSGNRIEYLDVAKGIAIILVIIGHCYSIQKITHELICGFHMPFFFIMTGMLHGKRNKKVNLLKVLRNYLVPYYCFEIMFACFIGVLAHLSDFKSFFLSTLPIMLSLRGGSATWFLPCACIAQLFFWMLGWGGQKTPSN